MARRRLVQTEFERAREADPPPPIPCAYDGCARPSICRVHVATGWLDVCLWHYERTAIRPRIAGNSLCSEIRAAS